MIKSTTTNPDPEVLLATQMLAIDEVRMDKQHVLRTLSAALSDGPEFSSHQTFPLKYQLLEEQGRYVLTVGDTGEDGLRILLEGHYYDGLILSLFFDRWDGADDYAFWQHVVRPLRRSLPVFNSDVTKRAHVALEKEVRLWL